MHPLRRLVPVVVLAVIGTSFVGTAGTAFAADGPPVYRIDAVVNDAIGLGINEAGDFVGWQTDAASPRAFVYRGGQLTLLPNPPERPLSIARDISDNGVVVGNAYKEIIDEPGHAMRWTLGANGWTVQDLGVLTGEIVSEATGLNEAGQVVGHSNPRSFLYEQGFLYSDANGMTALLPDETFVPQDINESAVVVGNGYSTAKRVDTTSGRVTNLSAAGEYEQSYAYALNDAGQVSGTVVSLFGNGEVVARYTDGTGWQELGGIGGGSCSGCVTNVGWGINSAGTVVGTGWPRVGVTAPYERGVIYLDSEGSLLYVDDLLQSGNQWSVDSAFDINDSGQIVGRARNLVTGQWAGVRLSPVEDAPADIVAPTVHITYPVNGETVSSVIYVTISATDDVDVDRVELKVGTRLTGPCTLSAPPIYTCRWNTLNWKNGWRTLHARAWDGAGNLGTDDITVRVRNRR